jgi:hypothetical protein
VSPVKYEMGFYIPEDDILHSHRLESLNTCRNVALYCGKCLSRKAVHRLVQIGSVERSNITVGAGPGAWRKRLRRQPKHVNDTGFDAPVKRRTWWTNIRI